RGLRPAARRSAPSGRRCDADLRPGPAKAARVRNRTPNTGIGVNGEEPVDDAIRAVTDAVAESRRYRAVDPAVVRRMAREELGRAHGRDDAVKRVKRRLHQAVGAYRPGAGGAAPARDLERLRTARERDPSGAELRATCLALLARHTSTRERLPV